jgi:hypothetical protein
MRDMCNSLSKQAEVPQGDSPLAERWLIRRNRRSYQRKYRMKLLPKAYTAASLERRTPNWAA